MSERAIALDAKSDYGHVFHAGILKFLGRDRDADIAFTIADALNPNSLILCMARGNAEFAKVNPDPTVFREVASRALRLSPRDPQAYLFHNLLGAARLVENCWEFDEESANAFATASRYQNASEAVVVNAAFASVQVGRNDDAVLYLDMLRRKNPDISGKQIIGRNSFYKWVDRFLEKNEVAYEKLVKLGLPRE